MAIDTKSISDLREKTGAGIVECKKALEESAGDIEKAIEVLRKKGIAKAAKRGERETREGVIKVATNKASNIGFIVELGAETDFVVRNDKFQNFGNSVMELIIKNEPDNLESLLDLKMADGHTVKENFDTLSGVIGEKMEIKRYGKITSQGTVVGYSHLAGKIGVLVALDKSGAAELGHDIAMQIAAANPKYISPDQVPAEEIAKEKEIYAEQLKKEGKPDNMIEKIMAGKVNKYLEEICLIKQEYIKDDEKKVEDILNGVKIEKFVMYSLQGAIAAC